jgi:nitroimidazol reductase NimA-like FMN-containing flavoprotein (pyridoxamine 5'-phosphate oxidase superfamily)
MQIKTMNLDGYGHDPLPWSRALEQLEAPPATTDPQSQDHTTFWLTTVRADGQPHATGVGALWREGRFYFTSGAGTQKSRNLAKNPNCVISVALPGLDLVVEGAAAKVTDEATLERLAKEFRDQGWPATVKDGAFTAEFSAPSAGPPPWDLYEVTATTMFGLATAEPYGATRWKV